MRRKRRACLRMRRHCLAAGIRAISSATKPSEVRCTAIASGQILCTLQALAAAAVLRDAMPGRIIVAGYSVGEVAAWGVAGVFERDRHARSRRPPRRSHGCRHPARRRADVRSRALPRRHRPPVRALRGRGRHRQSRRCLRRRRRPRGAAGDRGRSEGDARCEDRRSAGRGGVPHPTARRGFCGVSGEPAPDITEHSRRLPARAF